MAAPIRTKNRFISPRHFVAFAFWKAARGGLLVWPSAWLELAREPSLGVRVSRLVGGWWHWRVQVEMGSWDPVSLSGPIDWDRMGIDSYLAWARKTFARSWGRMEVERLFRADPAWRRLATMGTARNHYVRVTLARAMLAGHAASDSLGANQSLATLDGTGREGPPSGDDSSRSLLDSLEVLSHNLRAAAAPPKD